MFGYFLLIIGQTIGATVMGMTLVVSFMGVLFVKEVILSGMKKPPDWWSRGKNETRRKVLIFSCGVFPFSYVVTSVLYRKQTGKGLSRAHILRKKMALSWQRREYLSILW